jgi:hypothetical protein
MGARLWFVARALFVIWLEYGEDRARIFARALLARALKPQQQHRETLFVC